MKLENHTIESQRMCTYIIHYLKLWLHCVTSLLFVVAMQSVSCNLYFATLAVVLIIKLHNYLLETVTVA